jgi:iron complex transport system substrate-binding protein
MKQIAYFLSLFLAASAIFAVMPGFASDYTLRIFGNANMDDSIDEEDVAYVEGIINGSNDPTSLGDANYDGTIDGEDLDQIEKIIDGDEKELTIIDSAGRVITVKMPIDRVVAFNNEQIETLRSINAKDKIIGVGSYIKDDEILSEFFDYPCVGNTKNPNYEELVTLNPEIALIYATFSMTEAEAIQDHLEELDSDIEVVRLDAYKPESYVEELRILGYLLDRRTEAEEFINFYESWMNSIEDMVDQIPEEEKPLIYYENRKHYYSAGNGTGHQQKIDLAGGSNIFADSNGYFDVDPEAVVENDPEMIIRITTDIQGYSATDSQELMEIQEEVANRPELAEVKAVKNKNIFVISNQIVGNVRHFIGIGYLAKWLHPELFRDLDPNSIHHEYLERFQGLPEDFLGDNSAFVYPEPA